MLLAGMASRIQNLVSLVSRQAFIPQVNWEAGESAELGGKGTDFLRAGAFSPGHVEWVADNDGPYCVASAQSSDRAEDFPRTGPGPAVKIQRHHWLGSPSKLV